MKKWMMLIVSLLSIIVTLVACNNGVENKVDENEHIGEGEKQQEARDKTKTSERNAKKNIKVEDQLDLKIGDKGTFDTTIGSYEMTVESAKLVGPEFEGIESRVDNFLLIDLKIQNISEEQLNLDDIMVSMQVTEDLDESGYHDASGAFDSVNAFTGSINPGEEVKGQFIVEVFDSEIYYFR